MRKSSSSGKKKRSKYSSQGLARKRKDTKISKSKRLRRRDESYSDDYSTSSLSVSSFDSEDCYRSRRSRSRTRKDVKGSKKRAFARSSSSDESPCVRKRKRSKRNDERKKMHEKKTKKKRKKKGRRASNVSSSCSESWSCSTCQSPSSQSDEGEYERCKGWSERRDNEKRKSENTRNGARRRRYRSGSCSSCSRHNDVSDFLMSNIMIGENTSKRLRSVIVLPGEDNEFREWDKDKHKEEITYDHDDYPSSRSNDSNDGLNDMEERPIEDEKREDAAAASNSKGIELIESDKVGEGQHTRNKAGYDVDGVGTNDTKKEKNEVSGVIVDSVNGEDLETILRRKALENLKSFRNGLGGFQTNAKSAVIQKDKCDGTAKSPYSAMPEPGLTKSPKVVGAGVVREDSVHSSLNEKILDGGICCSESSSAKYNVHQPDQVAIPKRVSTIASSSKNKPRLITSARRQALSNVTTTLNETPASLETNQPKLVSGSSIGRSVTLKETPASWEANHAKLATGISLGKSLTLKEAPASLEASQEKLVSGSKNATSSAHTVTPPMGNDNDDKVNDASVSVPAESSSCLSSAAGDISLNKSEDDGKEGAQLEQKTMSVMRGGEMVQVNYKVYIPKKTPALARRQLKR